MRESMIHSIHGRPIIGEAGRLETGHHITMLLRGIKRRMMIKYPRLRRENDDFRKIPATSIVMDKAGCSFIWELSRHERYVLLNSLIGRSDSRERNG